MLVSGATCKAKLREDRGDALQVAVLVPVLLLAFFVIFQIAFWFHAKGIALAAAEQGARAASAQNASASDGGSTANSVIAEAGGDKALVGVTVSPSRNQSTATVTVTGHGISLVPGLPGFPVSQTASYPVERFTDRSDR